MQKIEWKKEDREVIVDKIKRYFEKELDCEIGSFDAAFLLDFFADEIGGYFYNQGLNDARDAVAEHNAALIDSLYSMEEIL